MNSVGSACLAQLTRHLGAAAASAPKQTARVMVNLEWNSIDEPEEVKALAKALVEGGFQTAESGQALFQLANNELGDLEAAEVLDISQNLIML
eukprot:g2406.t1